MKEESHKRRKLLYTGIKLLVLVLGGVWVYHNWQEEYLLGFIYPMGIISMAKWSYLAPALLLYFINWFVETKKWQLLIKRTEHFSLKRGMMAVFAGTSASALIPYKMGSYLGRMLFLRTPFKVRAIPPTILGNLLQSSITFFIGIFAAFYLLEFDVTTQNFYIGFAITFFLALISLPFYYKKLARFINGKVKKLLKRKQFRLFSLYEKKTIWKAWFLSLLRYLAFALHFVLLLKAFGIESSLGDLIIAVSAIYFLQSFAPSVVILDFGVKAGIAAGIFSIYTSQIGRLNNILVFHYLLNSIVPVMIGALCILLLKVRNK